MRGRLPALAAALAGALLAVAPGDGAVASGTIAFVRFAGDTAWIETMRTDGTGARALTRPPAGSFDADPAWSPDGARVAFARLEPARGWRISVVGADGRGLRRVTGTEPLAEEPSWSPDGSRLAYAHLPRGLPKTGCWAQQIFVVAVDGTGVRRLTSFQRFQGGAGKPAWSPDGRTILFEAKTSQQEGGAPDLYTTAPDGSRVRRLLRNAGDPSWSRDGSRIAFVRGREIYTADADGGGVRRLTHDRYYDADPAWSPDGRAVAYASVRGDTQEIYAVGADGTGSRRLTRSGEKRGAHSPDWRPSAAAASQPGRARDAPAAPQWIPAAPLRACPDALSRDMPHPGWWRRLGGGAR